MKRFLTYFLLAATILNLAGCNGETLKHSFKRKKPTTYYYSDILVGYIKDSGISQVLVLETNLRRERNLSKEDTDTLTKFFSAIKTNNFLSSAPKLPAEPEFKFYIECKDKKFVINVYNEKYVSIFPWDGAYDEDYIDMTNIKPLYNLYTLCKYLYK